MGGGGLWGSLILSGSLPELGEDGPRTSLMHGPVPKRHPQGPLPEQLLPLPPFARGTSDQGEGNAPLARGSSRQGFRPGVEPAG